MVAKRRRVITTLPPELHRWLRAKAGEWSTFTEVVLDAYSRHHEVVRKEYAESRVRAGLPPRPRPRRRHPDGTATCVLFLIEEEQAVIDGFADELGMSRSELVQHLLDLELGGNGPLLGSSP